MAIPTVGSIYVPSPAHITRIEPLTASEKLFTIELPWGQSLDHQPGQFVAVSLLGIGEAPISISSAPSRSNGTFELCVRKAGDVTTALHKLAVGATIGLRGPLGHGFQIEKMRGKDLLFVLSGLGLACARSLINQALDERGAFGRVIILYSAGNPAELLFKDELDLWRRRSDVELHVTVDRPDAAWADNVGVITTLFQNVNLNPRNTIAVTVGPALMYRFVLLELLGRGIPETQIWLSLERRMKCGVGKCGHCQINNLYCCQDGPIFTYAQIKGLPEALQ